MAVFLTGFMATGKSTIGRVLAARLDKPFIDLDAEIERRAGKSIAALFADEGEEFFRSFESEVLASVAPNDAVVATGGGAFIAAANRELMRRHGPVVCLTASAEEILRRTKGDSVRPLLAGDDRETRVRHLMAERAPAYDCADLQVNTTRVRVGAIVEQILAFLRTQPHSKESQGA